MRNRFSVKDSNDYAYGKEHSSFKRRSSHKRNRRNKLKLIIAIIICLLVLVSITVYEIYTAFIVPRIVKPVLEEVVTIMQDDRYTSGITREIKRLYEAGEIAGPEVEKYLEQHTGTENESSHPEEKPPAQNTSTEQNNTDNTTSSLGITPIKVKDNNSPSSKVNYYSSGKKVTKPASDNTVSIKELQTMSSDELYAKAKSIMSAEDFSLAMSLRPKISVSKIKALKNDTTALMEYIKSVLTPEEYADMLYIYTKYSNHLTN